MICDNLIQSKEHALVGISPFNSYYSECRIGELIHFAHTNFKDFHLFIPNTLPYFNFIAMGYLPNKAKIKTKRQWNYLKNKIIRAFVSNGFSRKDFFKKIITIDETMDNNISYNQLLELCFKKYESDISFKEDCLTASSMMLRGYPDAENNSHTKNTPLKMELAVQYLLRELPLLLDTPKILGVTSSVFVYHEQIDFFKKLYGNCDNKLLASNQGFLTLKL